jgi:epoxyqueuosine reductase
MNELSPTAAIKAKALELGFDACGIATASDLPLQRQILNDWLQKGYHGEMQYLNRNIDKRTDPRLLMENCQSVISVLIHYHPSQSLSPESKYQIARYAYGDDYHKIIKDKLYLLMEFIQQKMPQVTMRAFSDSAPILDKTWAIKAGLGWMGKNTLLLNKKLGSYFFIGEILISAQLDADNPITESYCGSCTRCIDACPTQALIEPYVMDSRLCISYLTIESKTDVPESLTTKINSWIYGCDICQEVCPWNHYAKPQSPSVFKLSDGLTIMRKQDWEQMDEATYQHIFAASAIKRSGFARLKKMIEIQKDES